MARGQHVGVAGKVVGVDGFPGIVCKCVYPDVVTNYPEPRRKNVVLSIATGPRGKLLWDRWGHTHKPYAELCGADHVLIDGDSPNPEYQYADKFAIYPLLGRYERVLYIDADVEVNHAVAGNMFDEVPENLIGLFDERAYYINEWIGYGISRVAAIGSLYGFDFYHPHHYLSSGIMLAGRQHQEVFSLPEFPFVRHNTYEQDLILARVLGRRHKVYWMGPDIQFIHSFGQHAADHAWFKHWPGVVPYTPEGSPANNTTN